MFYKAGSPIHHITDHKTTNSEWEQLSYIPNYRPSGIHRFSTGCAQHWRQHGSFQEPNAKVTHRFAHRYRYTYDTVFTERWNKKQTTTIHSIFSTGYNSGADETEAPGSSFYITKEGGIDYEIVLLAVHCVFKRDSNICTLRVLETGLNICELLLDLGVLKLGEHAHTLAMGIVKRALLHLGCPHGCNDGTYVSARLDVFI